MLLKMFVKTNIEKQKQKKNKAKATTSSMKFNKKRIDDEQEVKNVLNEDLFINE